MEDNHTVNNIQNTMQQVFDTASQTINEYTNTFTKEFSGPAIEWAGERVNTVDSFFKHLRHPISNRLSYLEPEFVLGILLLYILLVHLGKRCRKNTVVGQLSILHHGIGALVGALVVSEVLSLASSSRYRLFCIPEPEPSDIYAIRLAQVYRIFYFYKIYQLFDVFFSFAENKKVSPTFCVFQFFNVLFAWFSTFHAPFGDLYLPVTINALCSSIVHVLNVCRLAKWRINIPSTSKYTRPLMYVQCLVNIALSLFESLNQCPYPNLITHPFLVYNLLIIAYALAVNSHTKQD